MGKSKELGKALRKLREEKSMGIKSAAPKADVSYTYLSKVENGHKSPSIDLLRKLCEVYGVNFDDVAPLAGELPDDIQKIISENGADVFDLLRKNFGKDAKQRNKDEK